MKTWIDFDDSFSQYCVLFSNLRLKHQKKPLNILLRTRSSVAPTVRRGLKKHGIYFNSRYSKSLASKTTGWTSSIKLAIDKFLL